MKRMSHLRQLKRSILAYNKYLPIDEVERKTPVQLLRLCHPTDRKVYALQLLHDGVLEKDEAKEFLS